MAQGKHQEGSITTEIFAHLVQLAAFELTEAESAYLRKELNAQLGAIRELEAIEVGPSVAITSHGVPYSPSIVPALREDEILDCQEADDIVAGSPLSEERYIIVPDIPHEELE